jgi:hypothetical protein
MQDLPNLDVLGGKDARRLVARKLADADYHAWFECAYAGYQGAVTGLLQGFPLGRRQFVGSTISPTFLHEAERAPVEHEEVVEEMVGRRKTLPCPTP